MGQNKFTHSRKIGAGAATIVLLVLCGYVVVKKGPSPAVSSRAADTTEPQPPVVIKTSRSSTNPPDSVLQIRPDTVLASVNGHSLTAQEVLPPGSSNRPVSLGVCEYFLKRAIDRELIFQTARAQGLQLDDSQKQQLSNFKTVREQPEPGLVRALNGGAAQMTFELQDAEAFMLQTTLLEKSGASPNVTSDQVLAYYQQHASDFDDLPADGPARQEVWANIEVQIRHLLAPGVRSGFQDQLAAYMSQLRAGADVQLTALTSFAAAN